MLLKRKSKGFTLIELMVVIVIIGILVAIALPNFISAQDRAKISSVKANAHTVQTMLETYAVDWQGTYPIGPTSLKTEASSSATNKYWKQLKNPFNAGITTAVDLATYGANGGTNTTTDSIGNNVGTGLTDAQTTAAGTSEGVVYYCPSSSTKYYIYGGDKGTGKAISEKGSTPFILSNS